jgi:hypothetical protein
VEIEVAHLGYSYGQHDYLIRALVAQEIAGTISFSEFDGIPHVNFIEVTEGYRRQGIALEMIRTLQRKYESVPIDFGYTTDSGTSLLQGISFIEVPNEKYSAAAERRTELQKQVEAFEAIAEMLTKADESSRSRMITQLQNWNDVLDELDQVEGVMAQEAEVYRLVNLTEDDEYTPRPAMKP